MDKRGTATWSAARLVGSLVHRVTRQLEAARSIEEVVACIRQILDTFITGNPQGRCVDQDVREATDLQKALQQHAVAVGWPVIQRCFYEDQFPGWATSVLTVAAGDWLPQDTDGVLRALVAATFHCSPAALALGALSGHLSAVLPKHSSSSSRVTVTAVAADTAAELVVGRFAAAGSNGVPELLKLADGQQQQQQQTPEQQRQSTQTVHKALSEEQLSEVAMQLASLPDRVQQLPGSPASLQPHTFVQHILQQAVAHIVEALAAGPADAREGSCSGAALGSVAFTGLLLQKFSNRGHAGPAAAAVLQLANAPAAAAEAVHQSSTYAACSAVLGSTHQQQQQQQQQQQHRQQVVALQYVLLQLCHQHAAATEKLLVQMLRTASADQLLHQPQRQQQQQQQQQSLQALLCPLLTRSFSLRTIASCRLLLSRTLPASTLDMLLQLLDSCQPSLLPEATVQLAESWSDKGTMQHLPVQQQAYMTAALTTCIDKLPKELLDPTTAVVAHSGGPQPTAAAASEGLTLGTASQPLYQGLQPHQLSVLLPSILQGVSSRLASPSPATRAQAMRVGRAFSVKLDPSKPLFEEAGQLELMPEEIWPGAREVKGHESLIESTQQQQQVAVEQKGVVSAAEEVDDSSHTSRTAIISTAKPDSNSSNYEALNRLHEALASPEPDSDDEQDDSAHSSGKEPITANDAEGDDDDDDDDDDDALSDGSVSSLIAFDLAEDLSAESWWGPDGLGVPEGKSLSLRGLAAAVRKADDGEAVLEALAKVEVLVRAEPDELPTVAPELARSLLHCKIPTWAEETDHSSKTSDSSNSQNPSIAASVGLHPNAEVQRQRALTAVLSLSPLTVGDTLIAELYSPHLDQYQRMLVLDCLAAAVGEMSDPRKAPRLAAAAPGQVPKLLPSVVEEKRRVAPGPTDLGSSKQLTAAAATAGERSSAQAAAAPPGMAAVSSRVWGKVSLQKQKAAADAAATTASSARTFKNRFAPVAIRWASLLLKACDVKQHGIDLFGRDSLLLGRLLTVLGAFVEAAAATPAAVPLAAGLLELLKANEVSGHKEVFVRRSALVAASQIVRHLPPARLAGAMIGRQQDVQDQALVERLQWLMSWSQAVAGSDVDDQCRMLAAGCCAWHVELAEGALACLEHLPEAEGPSLAGVGGVKGRTRGAGGQG